MEDPSTGLPAIPRLRVCEAHAPLGMTRPLPPPCAHFVNHCLTNVALLPNDFERRFATLEELDPDLVPGNEVVADRHSVPACGINRRTTHRLPAYTRADHNREMP